MDVRRNNKLALYFAFLGVFFFGMMLGGFLSDERVKANELRKARKHN